MKSSRLWGGACTTETLPARSAGRSPMDHQQRYFCSHTREPHFRSMLMLSRSKVNGLLGTRKCCLKAQATVASSSFGRQALLDTHNVMPWQVWKVSITSQRLLGPVQQPCSVVTRPARIASNADGPFCFVSPCHFQPHSFSYSVHLPANCPQMRRSFLYSLS